MTIIINQRHMCRLWWQNTVDLKIVLFLFKKKKRLGALVSQYKISLDQYEILLQAEAKPKCGNSSYIHSENLVKQDIVDVHILKQKVAVE